MTDERNSKFMRALAVAASEGAQAALRSAAKSYLEEENMKSKVEKELREVEAEVVGGDAYYLTIRLKLMSPTREEVFRVLETVEPRIKVMAPGLINSIKTEIGCKDVIFVDCHAGLEPCNDL